MSEKTAAPATARPVLIDLFSIRQEQVNTSETCVPPVPLSTCSGTGENRWEQVSFSKAERAVTRSADPIEPGALAVGCPLPWCQARRGDRCVTGHGRPYHWQRAMAGLAAEFPTIRDDDQETTT
jgi:hypothetical protein